MMNEKAIKKLEALDDFVSSNPSLFENWIETSDSIDTAIKALEQINKIKDIISIHPNYIEEDVMKYKMIVEVLNND